MVYATKSLPSSKVFKCKIFIGPEIFRLYVHFLSEHLAMTITEIYTLALARCMYTDVSYPSPNVVHSNKYTNIDT